VIPGKRGLAFRTKVVLLAANPEIPELPRLAKKRLWKMRHDKPSV
jgi:hypothetical protein